jgi:hypothetical protein
MPAPLATVNPAVYGLVGSLIGALAAGTASFVVARQARQAAEQAWVRDNRREIYDRFLTWGQRLLIALEHAEPASRDAGADTAYTGFFEAYGVVQTVAEARLVASSRDYAYRLQELRFEVDAGKPSGARYFAEVASSIRDARHDTIDDMRRELELTVVDWPPKGFSGFERTGLAEAVADARKRRAASL